MTLATSCEGMNVRNQGTGPYAAARAFAYLGNLEAIRAACINECGCAPPRKFIEELIVRQKMFRTHTGNIARPSSEPVAPYSHQKAFDDLETANSRFVLALRREREISRSPGLNVTDGLVNATWDLAARGGQ